MMLMEIKKETVCEDTLYIIREYYRLNTGQMCIRDRWRAGYGSAYPF